MAESAPRRGTLWSGSHHVHVRPLGHDTSCAFVAFTGSHGEAFSLPDTSLIEQWLDTLAEWGYRRVRTNAVISTADTALRDAGFTVVQDLTLLSMSHWTPSRLAIGTTNPPKKVLRWGVLRKSVRREILALDAHAFGPEWCLDEDLLTDAVRATTHAQVFVARDARLLHGFVVVGASGGTGYVQRLAVSEDRQGQGIGHSLVATAVNWAQKRGCTHTVVNTEVGNVPARRLYEKIGFVALPNRLTVLQKELR